MKRYIIEARSLDQDYTYDHTWVIVEVEPGVWVHEVSNATSPGDTLEDWELERNGDETWTELELE